MEILFVLGLAILIVWMAKNIFGTTAAYINPASTPQQLDKADKNNDSAMAALLILVVLGLSALSGVASTGISLDHLEHNLGYIVGQNDAPYLER